MSDANNIYKLYAENAANQQPTLTTTPEGNKKWHLNGVLHRDASNEYNVSNSCSNSN
jgi:hypothetical protein